MKDQNDVYKLANGVEVPCIGFGMWQTPDDRTGINAVKSAIAARIEENLKAFDFALEEEDVRLIASLTGCVGLSGNPDAMPF